MELRILDMIQQMRTPFLDSAMPLITKLGDAGIFWIIVALVLLIIPKTRKTGIIVAMALIFDVIICNGLLKPIVARVRPYDVNTAVQLLIKKETDYSFPSGHTSVSFTVASALLFAGNKKLGWAAVVLSGFIAFSRLYLYMHYPTDVLAGLLVGILCGYLGYKTVAYIQKRRAARS